MTSMGSVTGTAGRAKLTEVSPAGWEALAARRVFFGHQSVGRDIMEGVREIVAERPEIALRVVHADDPALVEGAAFIEGRIGVNRDPASKTSRFCEAARGGLGAGAVALHKYCYVDVRSDTDVERLFDDYARSLRELERTNPGLMIVHVTMPLTTSGGGAWEIARTAVGRPTDLALNIKRNRFNERMRATYAATAPVFDLALLQATAADGSPSYVRFGSRLVPRLAPEWTYDGGHLNPTGRRRLAEQLLVMLARVPGAAPERAQIPADASTTSA